MMVSAIVSVLLFIFWVYATLDGYDKKSAWNDIGLWMIICVSCIGFTAINIILLLVITRKPIQPVNGLIVFLSVHTCVWGLAYLILSLLLHIDGKLVPLFLLPFITGGINAVKIYRYSIRQ